MQGMGNTKRSDSFIVVRSPVFHKASFRIIYNAISSSYAVIGDGTEGAELYTAKPINLALNAPNAPNLFAVSLADDPNVPNDHNALTGQTDLPREMRSLFHWGQTDQINWSLT
jgi:hypothetical protein